MVVPKSHQEEVLSYHHGHPGVGHFGVNKILNRAGFYWGTCRRDVEAYCQRCDPCIARKGPTGQSRAPLQQYQFGTLMDIVAVDRPLPCTPRGNLYVVVAMGYFTK